MDKQIKYVHCDDLEVMVSFEGQITERHPFYFGSILLLYMQKGTLHVELEDRKMEIGRGNFALLNRFTSGIMYKTWTAAEGEAQMYAFALRDNFIEQVKQQDRLRSSLTAVKMEPIYILPTNPILQGLFASIINYLNAEQVIDKQLLEIKTLEALLGILKFHPECQSIFQQDFSDQRVDLRQFMEVNYMHNIPLSMFAKQSGRSLSTFCREFKSIYQETPHRWLQKRRLREARTILSHSNLKPSEFYLRLGFESLAHFSRAFKNEFGVTLTSFRKSNSSI
ncbi:MAG: helix-turn-helix transcriptional regulator [Saprospiraceae bacterium]